MCCCLFGGGGVKSKTGLGLVSSIEQNPNPFQPTKKSPKSVGERKANGQQTCAELCAVYMQQKTTNKVLLLQRCVWHCSRRVRNVVQLATYKERRKTSSFFFFLTKKDFKVLFFSHTAIIEQVLFFLSFFFFWTTQKKRGEQKSLGFKRAANLKCKQSTQRYAGYKFSKHTRREKKITNPQRRRRSSKRSSMSHNIPL